MADTLFVSQWYVKDLVKEARYRKIDVLTAMFRLTGFTVTRTRIVVPCGTHMTWSTNR
ncbi:hypothetical protein KIN20_020038 [Parelaphostrongylus tenuis]|uniref:Uncharacterized protein n=1 Tax=Parelaphostrongylus tenuis TaxID=148309 RepID=A0AAD5MM02_PARTN|nr:hypothetical protein KIN20_020038 [Parelaphostrongylus tenuis]